MKVFVIGASGFVGRNVAKVLKQDSTLEVITAGRGESEDEFVDLLDRTSIDNILKKYKPEVVINCAGIVVNTENAFKNVEFCKNIFESIVAVGTPYPKVIISGSAAEYGVVDSLEGAVSEDMALNATSNYGRSKIEEVALAESYAIKYKIDVVVARIFNPIGPGMGQKFLITNLMRQIEECQQGKTEQLSLSRLDAKRDYIDIRDVAEAIHRFAIVDNKEHHVVQNVGSGMSVTNGQLLTTLLDHIELTKKPTIIETQDQPEPSYAAKADLSRIKAEYGWEPKYDLNTTMEDIIHGQSS